MLQKTHVISFFCGICLENHQIGSVPWCDKWKISSAFFMFFPTKLIKTAQYHDATNDVPHLNVFTVFCIKSGKAARYHDATNDARHLKFSCFFFHAIIKTHPYRGKWHASSHVFAVFSMKVTKTAQYHAATNDRFHLHFWSYSPWN